MKKIAVVKSGAPLWMVTYGDMMTLILTFFILLAAFAEMDAQKFRDMTGQIEKAFGVQRNDLAQDVPKGMDLIAKDFDPRFTEDQIEKKLKNAMKVREKGNVEVLQDMRGVVMRISEENFFDKGSAKIRPSFWPVLDTVIEVSRSVKNNIIIESHTDDTEYKNTPFKDVWELSAQRSVEVTRYFITYGNIDKKRLHPSIKGDAEPLQPNINEANRKANRRIEIIFEKDLEVETQELNKLFNSQEQKKGGSGENRPVEIFNLGR